MMQRGLYADLYEQMANTDPLTNLYNRNALLLDESSLNELIRNDNSVGVVMFDVNDLKYFTASLTKFSQKTFCNRI